MDLGIAGRVALVTGGARNLGKADALVLAKEGCAVAVVDLNAEGAQETAREIVAKGGKAKGYACDIGCRAPGGLRPDRVLHDQDGRGRFCAFRRPRGRPLQRHVNVIAPGIIGPMVKLSPMYDRMVKRVAMQREGDPEDVAHAIAFVCSERARYITGAVLTVTGGIDLFTF